MGLSPISQIIIITLTIVLAGVNCVLAFLTWRARQWKTTADSATTALEVANAERNVWKERGERLSAEKTELVKDLATLQARTDLQPLVDAIKAWTIEGRGRFDSAMQRLEVIHSENVAIAARNTVALEQVTTTLASLSKHVSNLTIK